MTDHVEQTVKTKLPQIDKAHLEALKGKTGGIRPMGLHFRRGAGQPRFAVILLASTVWHTCWGELDFSRTLFGQLCSPDDESDDLTRR